MMNQIKKYRLRIPQVIKVTHKMNLQINHKTIKGMTIEEDHLRKEDHLIEEKDKMNLKVISANNEIRTKTNMVGVTKTIIIILMIAQTKKTEKGNKKSAIERKKKEIKEKEEIEIERKTRIEREENKKKESE